MNGLVQHVGYTLYLSGPLPLLGPGADVRRQHGFTRGKAYSLGAFKNYGSVHRPGLLAECRARGLTDTGTVAALKARLARSDTGQVDADDWRPLAAAGPAADLDTDDVKISEMDWDAVTAFIADTATTKDGSWKALPLPPAMGQAEGPRAYALHLVRQFAAALIRAPDENRNEQDPRANGDRAPTAGSDSADKRPRDLSATEIDAEVRVRGMDLRSFLLTDPGQVDNRRTLLHGGAFRPDVVAIVEALILPTAREGLLLTAQLKRQLIDDVRSAVGDLPAADGAAREQAPPAEDQATRIERILAAAERRSNAMSGETKSKMERLESRARATAATLASVALPADQAAWRDKIMQLEKELNRAEDMEAEVKAAGGVAGQTLTTRLKDLRTRLQLYSVAARDGQYGLEVVSQLDDREHFGAEAMEKYAKLEKALKKRSEKTMWPKGVRNGRVGDNNARCTAAIELGGPQWGAS